MKPVCSVSIDVDPIECYYRIHGLGETPETLRHVILRNAIPRFAEFFQHHGIRATFFVVGKDLDEAAWGESVIPSKQVLSALVEAGHELANHSYSHKYELAQLPSDRLSEELGKAHDLIGEVAGKRVTGFRSPGYNISPALLHELTRLGYEYDSSIFPSPCYYFAKAAIMGGLRLVGRKSGAVITEPRALLAPLSPYRPNPNAPWRRGNDSLVEFPVQVSPWLRIPMIGTTLLLAPDWIRQIWLKSMKRQRFVNFELHGIDLADKDQDRIPIDMIKRRPELKVPLERRLEAFQAFIDHLSDRFDFCPLSDATKRMESLED